MSKRDAQLLLADILEAIEKIERYVTNFSEESFFKDAKTVDAVVRNLEIIGEAANRLPDAYKAPIWGDDFPRLQAITSSN